MAITKADIQLIDEKIQKSHNEILEFSNAAIISRVNHFTSSQPTKDSIKLIRMELKTKASKLELRLYVTVVTILLGVIWGTIIFNGRTMNTYNINFIEAVAKTNESLSFIEGQLSNLPSNE